MGMAASQARLGYLTFRKNTIGGELNRLSMQKMSLTREMSKVSKDYQDALNTKTLKWSNNAGVTYVDLSYQNLMTPSNMNQQTPYLLTDTSGKIVVDSAYKKYAEMISADGKAGGDWESVRTQVLSSLTGIPAESIDNVGSMDDATAESLATLWEIEDNEPDIPTKNTSFEKLISKMGSSTGIGSGFSKGSTWADAYKNGGTISLGSGATATANLDALLTNITNTLGKYLLGPDYGVVSDEKNPLYQACDTFAKIKESMEAGADLSAATSAVQGNSSGYSVNVKLLLDEIIGAYTNQTGNGSMNSSGTTTYEWYDVDSTEYLDAAAKHAEWQKTYDEALDNYEKSVQTKNSTLSAEQESQINFYDTIFSAIAEKGWTYNSEVRDTDYLNQMLQNNLYTLTTVERNQELDQDSREFVWENSYTTDIASNFTNVYSVNDNSVQNEALAEYEYKKNIISAKETRIDTRMQDLQTEQAAINQMIQGIEQVRNDNTERTFSIFS